jgi:hypothetical protein
MKVKKMSDYNISEISFLSRSALQVFEERACNLMATFDADAVYNAIASLMRLEGIPEDLKANFSLDSLLLVTQRAFLTLLDRGALDSLVRFKVGPDSLAQQELDAMNLSVNGTTPDTTTTSNASTPTDTPEQLLEALVIKDWQALPAAEIRKKKATIAGYATAIERACESGQI